MSSDGTESATEPGPVLVTGATGFLALHIVQLLQREGYRVRGTVRSLRDERKLQPLRGLCPGARFPDVELVEADLTRDEGWDAAARGCTHCLHVASPFPNAPPRRDEDLTVPAVEGTRRVLAACARAGTVRRVVLTSSISAVHGESSSDEGRTYTEEDWSDTGAPDMDAYARSKTLAERAAWQFVEGPGAGGLELSVVNPALVMGPPIGGVVCTSLELVKRLMEGSMPLIPRLHLAACDVRDVALSHLRAMTEPRAAGRRHLVAASHLWLGDMAHVLRNEFAPQGYFVPTWPAPYFSLYLYAFLDRSTRLILPRIGRTYAFSGRRMREVLRVEPRGAAETLVDTVHGLIECGAVKRTKGYVPRKG